MGVSSGMAVRRLTPRECERLQGFPDDYTLITIRGKPAADGPRYKALGNSMAVPVMRWSGERIQKVVVGIAGKDIWLKLARWPVGEKRPANLLNPTKLLLHLAETGIGIDAAAAAAKREKKARSRRAQPPAAR